MMEDATPRGRTVKKPNYEKATHAYISCAEGNDLRSSTALIAELMTRLARFEASLFTAPRITGATVAMAAVGIGVLAWQLVSGRWVVGADGALIPVDFAFIWVSGKFAAATHPASAYDYAVFANAQAAFFGPAGDLPYSHFLYPPIFFLFTALLGLMPYLLALAIWCIGTFALYEIAIGIIVPRTTALIAAAAVAPVIKNIQLGQCGFLTAGLLGLSLAVMERMPVLSGVLLGLMTYKPQFGVLIPFALFAGKRWRVLLSATVTTLILGCVTALLFGIDSWIAFFDTLRGFSGRLSPDPVTFYQFQSVFGWLLAEGAAPGLAWAAHLAAALVAAVVIVGLWFGPASHNVKAAALCVGVIAVTPYVLTYDLPMLSLAAAFLVRDGLQCGFRGSERSVLLLAFLASMMLARPIGPVIDSILLALAVWRAMANRAAACYALQMR
jgi:hypothetical protein